MTKNYQDAIDSLLAKIVATDDVALAARLAEVAINLTHAANQAAVTVTGRDDNIDGRLEAALQAAKEEAAGAKTNNGSAGD